MNCPICNGSNRRIFQKHGYWIRECSACRHRFAELNPSREHIEHVYGDAYFHGGKDGYPDYLCEAEVITEHGCRYGRLLERYMTPGKLFDIGCAAGFILKGFQETGWRGQGIEPNLQMAEFANNQLGLDVIHGALEDLYCEGQGFSRQELEAPYDLVVMVQVLPHFYNLRKALQAAANLTRPMGYWLIETWNKDSIIARIMGQNWHEYSPPSVLHWFSPRGLRKLACNYGFSAIASGRPAKWINAAHASSLLQYQLQGLPFGSLVTRLQKFTPKNLPFPYLADDVFWMLFQKAGESQ